MASIFDIHDSTTFQQINQSSFRGDVFYKTHKNRPFLKDENLLRYVLLHGKNLKMALNKTGQIEFKGFKMLKGSKQVPFRIQKVKEGQEISEYTMTFSRLTGLIAAYIYNTYGDDPEMYPKFMRPLAEKYGFQKENKKEFLIYLWAVPGAEHYPEVFSFWSILTQKNVWLI